MSLIEMQEMQEMSSSQARDAIVSQHGLLRSLLNELVETAEGALQADGMADLLRSRARTFYNCLAEHMDFEERVLAAALRDVIGWWAVIQEKMESDHLRQREELTAAIVALAPDRLSLPALVDSVRAFSATLLVDMETEERGLMQADLDALTVDGRGG